jgi:hypothetical protein
MPDITAEPTQRSCRCLFVTETGVTTMRCLALNQPGLCDHGPWPGLVSADCTAAPFMSVFLLTESVIHLHLHLNLHFLARLEYLHGSGGTTERQVRTVDVGLMHNLGRDPGLSSDINVHSLLLVDPITT